MGLGDQGLEGVKSFCQQHKCNAICKKFELSDLSDEIDAMNTGEV